ncbi:MAG: AMP-binding protein [Gammaproteobacteria bacterium]|nr:AMP-binding protein [Gammaproteobacteria bacterium]
MRLADLKLGCNNNLLNHILKYSKISPDKTALTFIDDNNEISYTYDELYKNICELSDKLKLYGLSDSTAILAFKPSIEFVIAYLACIKEKILVGVCPAISTNNMINVNKYIDFLTQELKTSIIIVNNDSKDYINLSNVNLIILNDLISNYNRKTLGAVDINVTEDQNIHILYTSGSTSKPKGVIATESQLLYNINYTSKVWGFDELSTSLTIGNHYHAATIVAGILLPLVKGGRCIIMPTQSVLDDSSQWLRVISKYGVTHAGGPPYLYKLCIDNIKLLSTDSTLKKWKVAFIGSEVVSYSLIKKFSTLYSKYGFDYNNFCVSYGMTESNGLICSTPRDTPPTTQKIRINRGLKTFMGCGKASHGTHVLIVNNSKVLKDKQIGKIYVNSSSILTDYHNRSDSQFLYYQSKRYFDTQDLGFKKNGVLYVIGRSDRTIIVSGQNYNLDVLEQDMQSNICQKYHVISTIANYNDSKLVLILVFDKDNDIDMIELFNQVRMYLFTFYSGIIISDIYVILHDDLPYSQNRKLPKLKILYMINEKHIIPLRHFSISTPSCIIEKILLLSNKVRKNETLSDSEVLSLKELLTLDSIHYANLIYQLENIFNLRLKLTDILSAKTIGDLIISLGFVPSKKQSVTLQAKPCIVKPQSNYDTKMPRLDEKGSTCNILLTGALGFIGSHLLKFLSQNKDNNIYCLIRENKRTTFFCYFCNSTKICNCKNELEKNNVTLIAGDTELKNFGMSIKKWRNLCNKIDVIFHMSEYVNHFEKFDSLWAIYSASLDNVLQFAFAYKPKKLNYLSSLPVNNILEQVTTFNELFESQQLRCNYSGYLLCKAATELILRDISSKHIAISIFRLGQVTSTLEKFVINQKDIFHQLLRLIAMTENLPLSRALYVNAIPIDVLVESIILQNLQPIYHNENYFIYNIFNPVEKNLNQLFDINNNPTKKEISFLQWISEAQKHLKHFNEPIRRVISELLSNDSNSPINFTKYFMTYAEYQNSLSVIAMGDEKDALNIYDMLLTNIKDYLL